jgi:hypothetical protein
MLPLFIKAIKPPEKRTPVVEAKSSKQAKAATKTTKSATKTPDISHFSGLLGLLSEHKAGGNFGPDVVDVDHHVAFKAGDFTGSGKVTATGRDGLCVTDSSQREHRVHWREVTGHFAPEKDEPVKPKAKDGK